MADCIEEVESGVSGVECQFDYKTGSSDFTTPEVKEMVTGLLACSPFPKMTSYEEIDQSPEALDYAILELSHDIANAPVVEGGAIRGFVELRSLERQLGSADGLLVVQHPRAKPMKIDIGSVFAVGKKRIRHSVNTEGGSSGSPVFDADLTLVALHHAGFDWPSPELSVQPSN